MKKFVSVLLAAALLLSLCACGDLDENSAPVSSDGTTSATENSTTAASAFASATETTASASTTSRTDTASSAVTTKTTTTTKKTVTTATTSRVTGGVEQFDPLKPEIRFFTECFDLSGMGDIVDISTRWLDATAIRDVMELPKEKVWYCLTADGFFYDISTGLYSSNTHWYKYWSESYAGVNLGKNENVRFAGIHRGECYIYVPNSKAYYFDLDSWWGEYVSYDYSVYGKGTQVVSWDDGKATALYTFPAGETVVDVYGYSGLANGGFPCTVVTNKGTYILEKKVTEIPSGYVDVPPTYTTEYVVKKVQLEESVAKYFCAGALTVLITKDKKMYCRPQPIKK